VPTYPGKASTHGILNTMYTGIVFKLFLVEVDLMADQVSSTLRKALARLTNQKAHIDRQMSAIETALGTLNGRGPGVRRRTRMSAAARAAIGRRMKAYWAKRRAKQSAKGSAKK
jgi:hypothetical protein